MVYCNNHVYVWLCNNLLTKFTAWSPEFLTLHLSWRVHDCAKAQGWALGLDGSPPPTTGRPRPKQSLSSAPRPPLTQMLPLQPRLPPSPPPTWVQVLILDAAWGPITLQTAPGTCAASRLGQLCGPLGWQSCAKADAAAMMGAAQASALVPRVAYLQNTSSKIKLLRISSP